MQGSPRVTKHHALIKRSQVAGRSLKNNVTIDVHNQNCSGSCALENKWHTKKEGSLQQSYDFDSPRGGRVKRYMTE